MRELLQSGYGYALSLTYAEADAEDLVQEAWLRLARRGHRHPERALLFTTIRHLHIDGWRRRRRLVVTSLDDAVPSADVADEDGRLAAVDLTQALGRLRAEEREAIHLQAVQGYTAAETARLMGLPRGTVLSLIHRGKARLRNMLCAAVPPEETP